MKAKALIFIPLLFLTLFLSACSIKVGGSSSTAVNPNDGGFWKSVNKGTLWTQKSLVANVSGRPISFGSFDLYSIARDPADRNTLYIGAINEGMLYTYDAGESWQRVGILGKIIPRAIAVDPENHCNVYVAVNNRLNKSTDCTRTWAQVYYDTDLNVTVNGLAINPSNAKEIFIATSRGDILRSGDGGGSWSAVERLKNIKLVKLYIAPQNSKVMFAASETKGIYRSTNGGATWETLAKNLKDFKDASGFKALAFGQSGSSTVFLVTKYGLLKSENLGDTWSKIELLTPDAKAVINAFAANPKNEQELYYVTNTTFYKSIDGGKAWTTKKLPSSRAGWFLDVDPVDGNILYLGVRGLQK
jgi:photosystem II stability/assembly factor-like uncharacterized protein